MAGAHPSLPQAPIDADAEARLQSLGYVVGTVSKPANLTEPHLKSGTRPQDVYARVRFGIAPVGMPAHAPPKYSDRDVWDLVRFVTAAPYPAKLPPPVRAAVYPNP